MDSLYNHTVQILNNLNQNKVLDSLRNVFTLRDIFLNFLQNIQRTNQEMDNPTKEDVLLSLLLKKHQEVVRDAKVKGNLSDSEQDRMNFQDFKPLRGVRKTQKKHCLDPRRAHFRFFWDLFVRIPGRLPWKAKGLKKSCLILKPQSPLKKMQSIPMCRRSRKCCRRPAWLTENSSASSNEQQNLQKVFVPSSIEEGTNNKLRCCLITQGVRDVRVQLEMELEKEVKAAKRVLSQLERKDKAKTFSETDSNSTGGNGNVR